MGVIKREKRLRWETVVEGVGFEVLNDVTEGLFLIWKRKEFQRTGA